MLFQLFVLSSQRPNLTLHARLLISRQLEGLASDPRLGSVICSRTRHVMLAATPYAPGISLAPYLGRYLAKPPSASVPHHHHPLARPHPTISLVCRARCLVGNGRHGGAGHPPGRLGVAGQTSYYFRARETKTNRPGTGGSLRNIPHPWGSLARYRMAHGPWPISTRPTRMTQ